MAFLQCIAYRDIHCQYNFKGDGTHCKCPPSIEIKLGEAVEDYGDTIFMCTEHWKEFEQLYARPAASTHTGFAYNA